MSLSLDKDVFKLERHVRDGFATAQLFTNVGGMATTFYLFLFHSDLELTFKPYFFHILYSPFSFFS